MSVAGGFSLIIILLVVGYLVWEWGYATGVADNEKTIWARRHSERRVK